LNKDQKHLFTNHDDDTVRLINDRANHLYHKLAVLDIDHLDIDDFGKHYFNSHHGGSRLFFSVQSSADIIYQSVKKTNHPIAGLTFMDYGAGLGTLYLLAGMVGFKKVYFNDYFPQWAVYAKIIADKLGIRIDDYISGDIDAVIVYGRSNQMQFDIIASRNVVEHIYRLRDFYSKIYNSGITGVCFATTTANYHNPAMRLKHYWLHYKVERSTFKKQREGYIQELVSGIQKKDLDALVKRTRGMAFEDLTNAVGLYFKGDPVPPVEFLRTNTCDCKTGVWAENLLTRKNYLDIIEQAGFKASYTAGFWDTHYKYRAVNWITGLLNRLIKLSGKKGYCFAPFVNITAVKK